MSCNRCGLISYCGEEHRTLNYTEHAEICSAVAQIEPVMPQSNTHRFSSWWQWIQSRRKLISMVRLNIRRRPLQRHEEEVILWSKTCVVCHQQAALNTCRRCFSANYCDEHAGDFRVKHRHDVKCDRLLLATNIDIATAFGDAANVSYRFLSFVKKTSRFEEMLEFCLKYILTRRAGNLVWHVRDYVLSDYLSRPLTVYSACKRSNSLNVLEKSNVFIHVVNVGAQSVDKRDLPAWEVLLHLVPEMLQLEILMVGPGLQSDFDTFSLCKRCTRTKRKLTFCLLAMPYYDHTKFKNYKSPSAIVGFHMNVDEDAWADTMTEIMHMCCPLFLTFSHEQKAHDNVLVIKQLFEMLFGSDTEPNFVGRNHFSGLVPHKDVETGDTYFNNEYLLVYIFSHKRSCDLWLTINSDE